MRKGQGQYSELMKNSCQRWEKSKMPVNVMRAQNRVSMDQTILEAYERYVLAQFKYDEEHLIDKERESAIESLIPGTVYYFHLYFLDLVKKKKTIDEFTEDQMKLYNLFEEKYGQSTQFTEIETWVLVTNRIEGLPKVDKDTNSQDIEQNIDVIEYLYDNYIKQKIDFNKPSILEDDQTDGSSLVEAKKVQTLDLEGQFDRALMARKMEQKYIDKVTKYSNKMPGIDYSLVGFENEINWSIFSCEYVYKFSESIRNSSIQFITNDSFFEKLAEYFDLRIQDHKKDSVKNPKFITSNNQFDNFTIEQLDKFNKFLRNISGIQIMDEDENFVSSYFSKIFSSELSSESQEFMNDEEKFQNLETLYLYAKNKNLPVSLKQILLYEALLITIKLENYKEDLFKEYLKLPKEENFNLKKQEAQSSVLNTQKHFDIWENCLNNVQQNTKLRVNRWKIRDQNSQAEQFKFQQKYFLPVSDSENVIPKYLEELCSRNKNFSLAEYDEDFTRFYLEQIEKKVIVYKSKNGLIDLGDDFDPTEFKRIQDEVLIRFKGSNKDKFQVDEEVFLNMSVKNVPELVIKIFEFNTETYYKKNLKPFDTSIVLHGMIPSFQRIEIFKDVPKNQILDKTYTFDELKGKIGLFIIEMQGNGKTSRAVIKKGSLTLIHRSTSAGHAAFIIDNERKICKGKKTGLWLKDKFYKCNMEQNGAILIPYAKSQISSKMIMIHNGFAQLTEFQQKSESYEFDAKFHMNTEQMLVGQEASILIRPLLKINGRKTSVEILKNVKVNLECRTATNEGKMSREYTDLKISDDQETVITFQVPVDLTDVEVKIYVQVQNVTMKSLEDYQEQKTYHLQETEDVNKISDFFFKKVGKLNFVYLLGRNGEPINNVEVQIKVKHKDFEIPFKQQLTTDSDGKVGLGALIDIQKVNASAKCNDENYINESWQILNSEKDKWTQSTDIHILEGEEIEIPVNITNEKLLPHEAKLIMTRHGKIIQNCFSRINVEKTECGLYHLIRLSQLEYGNYQLELNTCANQRESINITVHRGEYWENNFILKQNEIFLSSANKDCLRIDEVEIERTNEEKSTLTISTNNYSKDSHIHIYASQFEGNNQNSLFEMISKTTADNILITKFPFARWKNMFESNATIGDEIKYVMDRKKHENRIGNTLDRLSLLNQPNFIRNTKVLEEKINLGTKYSETQEQNQEKQVDFKKHKKKRKMNRTLSEESDNFEIGENRIKDIQNFLSLGPIQHFNLQTDENGLVKVEIQDLKNYSQLQIIGCNKESVVQRSIDVGTLLKSSESKIQTRDLSYVARKQNQDSGLQETRQSTILEKGGKIHIDDITSSKVVIIDNCTKIFQVIKEIGNYSSKFDVETLPLIDEVYFSWSTFDQKTKNVKFSKYTCHELNFFLYVRDKPFFNEVVRDFIKNKMEKTFIDWYLLQMDNQPNEFTAKILSYIDGFTSYDDLNSIELCLLIDTCLKKGTVEIQNKARILAQRIIDQSDRQEKKNDPVQRNKIFDIVLTLSGLDRKENLQDLFFDFDYDEEEEEMKGAQRNLSDYDQESESENMSDGESDEDDISQQAALANARFGGIQKNNSLVQKDKKKFDSSDYFKEHENLKNAAGLGEGQEESESECEDVDMGGLFGCDDSYGGESANSSSDYETEDGGEQKMPIGAKMMKQQKIQPNMNKESKQKKDIFSDYDGMGSNMKQARNQIMNDVGFQQLEKTSEYIETQYRGQTQFEQSQTLFKMNRFLIDYLRHLISPSPTFISSNFTDLTMKYLPFAFSLLNIPLESKQSKQQHQFKSDGKRGINIISGSNVVIFKKEIMSGECKIKNDFMVTHRYSNYRDNEGDEISEFLINKIYQCQIIMTNISPKMKQITLLYQIPDGSLPMGGFKYVDSKQFTLSPYTSQKTQIMFYFPAPGTFDHQSSNISENSLVISKSLPKQIIVREKRIITNVETFHDLMKTTPGDSKKKELILDLIRNHQEKIMDPKYGFYDDSVLEYYMASDPEFFLNVLEIIRDISEIDFINEIAYKHRKSLLQDARFKDKREVVMQLIQDLIGQNGKIKDFIYKPIESQIFSYQKHELFDFENKHLEYFPMVNQRVFSIGIQESNNKSGLKQIQNVEFSSAYSKFIHLALHQDTLKNNHLNLQTKQKLQLAYYLQLQDRINESVKVFKQIDITQIQADGNELCSQVPYDYMAAYFDFITDATQQFKIAREIVKKYGNNHNCFQVKFNKIREQLKEIDEIEKMRKQKLYRSYAKPDIDDGGGPIDPEKPEQITPEKKQQALSQQKRSEPIIHTIEIDDNSGQLQISSENMKSFKVKYYLIDAEILFSRSPFVKDQAEQFSYVKPFVSLEIDSNQTGDTKIELPEQVQNKNVVIEINSADIQKFKTFYSSKLKINLIEDFGVIKVFHKGSNRPLPKTYVKVFCKDKTQGELFFCDGFTDLRGKFTYANASGKSFSNVEKFSILISHDIYGQTIKEAGIPKVKQA